MSDTPVALQLVALLALAVACGRAAGTAAPGPPGARALIERGTLEMRTDPQASFRDAEGALALLQHAPDTDLQIRARLLLCDYQSERDLDAAEEQMKAARALLPRARRAGLRAGVMLCEGAILETAGDSKKAVEKYRQAVAVATSTHDDDMLAEGLFQLGYQLGMRGDYANGLAELRRAERLFQKLHKPLHQLAVLNSIAILYNRIGDYGRARHLYSQVLKAQTAGLLQRERAVTLSNLGSADENLGDWQAARAAYSECLKIALQIGYVRAQAYALRGLAAVANAAGDAVGALATLDRAEQLQPQTPDARLHARILLERGIALHRLNRLKESAAALTEAAKIFQRSGASGQLASTYSELAAVHAAARRWRAAYEDQTQAKSLSDQLLRNQINMRFAALKVEFDTAAKDQENAALLRENLANAQALVRARSVRHLQRIVIILVVLLALLAAIFALLQLRATRRLRVLAMTDELTGVPNRRAVLSRLKDLLETSEAATSVLILDIDHFKAINDDHGHPAGDEVLKLMARRLAALAALPAFFGRLGGEEFLLVLPATELGAARAAAELLREHVASIDLSGLPPGCRITASIGLTAAQPRNDTPSSVLKRADKALYAAKAGGRNCVRSEPPETIKGLAAPAIDTGASVAGGQPAGL